MKYKFSNQGYFFSTVFKTVTIILVVSFGCTTVERPAESKVPQYGAVIFSSSDTVLKDRFDWAKEQALFYAHHGEDKVGLWYEAALPNRAAFCMRDVSHQIIGANILGLQAHNLNMMTKFAENISESKDWCTYWEINKDDLPAPIDYRNDKEFWYNLPANFTLMDACYRLYLWTGDKAYINDDRFLNFYSKSVNEYVERWDLSMDKIMTRDRFINVPQPMDSTDDFHTCRGIPGYDETDPLKRYLGGDMFKSMYEGYLAYANVLTASGNDSEASIYHKKAENVRDFYDQHWWNEEEQCYYDDLNSDGVFSIINPAFSIGIGKRLNEPKAIAFLVENSFNVETQSYLPEIFYKYGENQAAYDCILRLSDENTKRREYPEVSYSIVGVYASGMMGIEPDGNNRTIKTLSRLVDKTAWAKMENTPILNNTISLQHVGKKKSTMVNQTGGPCTWIAQFEGKYDTLFVDGKEVPALQQEVFNGKIISFVDVNMKTGEEKTVSIL